MQQVNWWNATGQTSYAGRARKEDTLGGPGDFEQKLFSDRLILNGGFRLDDHRDCIGVDKGVGLHHEIFPQPRLSARREPRRRRDREAAGDSGKI